MIARLTGKVVEIRNDCLILDVAGVGYKIENLAPFRLGSEGQEVTLEIYTHVKENELRLFGFGSYQQLQLFEKLLSVSGVGPKAALAIISEHSVETICFAVENRDGDKLRVKGVGKKTLAKLVIELAGKLPTPSSSDSSNTSFDDPASSELASALENLGYDSAQIEGIKGEVDQELSLAEQIKAALKLISSR